MARVKMLLLLLLAAGIAHGLLTVPRTPEARRGFVTIGDREYYIGVDARVTWSEAASQCNELGLRLVSLEEATKNSDIRDYLIAQYPFGQLWSSGQRVGDTWVWSGLGQLFNYTDWGELQPDLPATEPHQACLNVRGWYGWFDDPCDAPHHFVCE